MALTANDKDNARAYLTCMGSVLEAVASGDEGGAVQILREMVGGDDETFDQTLSAHEALASVVTAGADESDEDEDYDDEEDESEEDADDSADEDESEDDEDSDEDESDDEDSDDEDESDEDDEDSDEDESDDDEDEDDEDEGGEADLTATASVSGLSDKTRRTRAALISVASQGLAYEDPTHVTASEDGEEDEDEVDSDENDDTEDELEDIEVPDQTVTARVKEAKQKRAGTTASVKVKKKKAVTNKNPGGFL